MRSCFLADVVDEVMGTTSASFHSRGTLLSFHTIWNSSTSWSSRLQLQHFNNSGSTPLFPTALPHFIFIRVSMTRLQRVDHPDCHRLADLSQCDNWMGISLLDIGDKLFAKIIQQRLQTDSQCGNRTGKGSTDMIF